MRSRPVRVVSKISGACGSERGDDVLVGALDVDDDGFGQAVCLLERFFDLGVHSRRHCDDGANDAQLSSPLEQS